MRIHYAFHEGGRRGSGRDVPILFFLNPDIPNLVLKNPESRQNYLIFAATGNAISMVRTSKRRRASDIFPKFNLPCIQDLYVTWNRHKTEKIYKTLVIVMIYLSN